MTGQIPTFSLPSGFLGLERNDPAAAICIASIPFDIGTTNRSGARFGPQAVRQASRMLRDGAHARTFADPLALSLADIGNFRIALGDIPATMSLIENQASEFTHLIGLGGDHGVTLPLLRALARRTGHLGLIHFDADEVHEGGPQVVAERVRQVVGDAPVYLSFDIDALDPAFAPGTGTPEIGGLASWQAQSILRRLGGLHFAGMDVVEVAPAYDVAEITALAAATIVWEYLALLAARTDSPAE